MQMDVGSFIELFQKGLCVKTAYTMQVKSFVLFRRGGCHQDCI